MVVNLRREKQVTVGKRNGPRKEQVDHLENKNEKEVMRIVQGWK